MVKIYGGQFRKGEKPVNFLNRRSRKKKLQICGRDSPSITIDFILFYGEYGRKSTAVASKLIADFNFLVGSYVSEWPEYKIV